jgi:hypothetical protein
VYLAERAGREIGLHGFGLDAHTGRMTQVAGRTDPPDESAEGGKDGESFSENEHERIFL